MVVRAGLPHADPWLLPLAALMSAIGRVEIYRLDPVLARDQSVWIIVGLAGFAALIFLLRDHRKLESYKYTLAAAAVVLLAVTMVAGTTVNGAKLWLRVGGIPGAAGRVRKAPAGDLPGGLPAREARGARPSPTARCWASASRRSSTSGRCS